MSQPLKLTGLDAYGKEANFAEAPKTETLAQQRRRIQKEQAHQLIQAQKELTLPDSPEAMTKGIPTHLWQHKTGTFKGESFPYRVFDSDTLYKTPRRTYQPVAMKQNEVEL